MNSSTASADAFARFAPALFVVLWSTGFVGAKFGLPYCEPITFMWYRYATVSVLLGAFVWYTRAPWPRSRVAYAHLIVSGLLLHGVFIAGVFTAIAHGMSSSITALIVGVQPLLTATVVGPLLGESISRRQWVGFVVGFAGLALTVVKTFELGALPTWGFASSGIALLAITFGAIYQKRYTVGIDNRVGALVQFMATAVVSGIVARSVETGVVDWNPRFMFALAWLCIVLSLGAISILWILIKRGAAAKVASLFYLVPPVTAIEGYFLFGETLHLTQMIGIATTAIGVALINRT